MLKVQSALLTRTLMFLIASQLKTKINQRKMVKVVVQSSKLTRTRGNQSHHQILVLLSLIYFEEY